MWLDMAPYIPKRATWSYVYVNLMITNLFKTWTLFNIVLLCHGDWSTVYCK